LAAMPEVAPAEFGLYQLKADPGAMLRLAIGTSVTIATLMCIPDAFSLLPVIPDLVTWVVRMAGLWLTAVSIWFLGFLGILHLARLVGGPLILSKDGIKLWRFGKTMPWESIKALGTEEQAVFARAFWLKRPVLRLTIYTKKRDQKLSTHLVPSFTFRQQQFKSLVCHLSKQAFSHVPAGAHVLLFASTSELDTLKRMCERSHKARFLLSIAIAFGLVMFLGRKTVVNYAFNEGTRAFRKGDYATARERYQVVVRTDPVFPAGWDQLARCEFRLGDTTSAEKHWLRALQVKPDMVEAKLGLSFLQMERRQFQRARELIEQALRLNPVYAGAPARVNLTQLYLNLGRTGDAMELAARLAKEDPGNTRARCLLARAYLQLDQAGEAREVFGDIAEHSVDSTSLPFYTLVKAELAMAAGHDAQAEQLLEPLVQRYGQTVDALVDLAQVRIARGKYTDAEKLLARASAASPSNPWPLIVRAQLALQQKDRLGAEAMIAKALALRDQDARALAACARLSLELGLQKQALELARQAEAVEPRSPDAHLVLKSLERVGEPTPGE